MKFLFTVPLLAALLVPFVSGQSLDNIPQCAQSAAISSLITTGCTITNYTCFCDDNSWINQLLPVVMSDCDPADFQTTVRFAQQLCGSVGVTLSISGVSLAASTPAATGTVVSPSSMSVAMSTSTSSSGPVMSSSTSTTPTTSASTTAIATASPNSAASPASASWLNPGLAVCPALASFVFLFFGNFI